LEVVAELIESTATELGYTTRKISSEDASITLLTRQTREWHQVVLHALPQIKRWHLTQRGDHVIVKHDAFFFSWYRVIIICVCALIPLAYCLAANAVVREYLLSGFISDLAEYSLHVQAVAFAACVGLMALGLRLVGGPSFGADDFWEHLQSAAECRNAFIEPLGANVSLRAFFGALAFMIYGVATLASPLLIGLRRPSELAEGLPSPVLLWLLFLLIMIGALVFVFFSSLRRGYGDRLLYLAPGWCCSFSLFLFFAGSTFPFVYPVVDRTSLSDLIDVAANLQGLRCHQFGETSYSGELTREESIRAAAVLAHARKFGIACFVGWLIVAIMSAYFFKEALRMCRRCREKAIRLNRSPTAKYHRTVVSGEGFVRSMQAAMATSWGCFGIALLCPGALAIFFGVVAWFDIKGFWITDRFALAADIFSALGAITIGPLVPWRVTDEVIRAGWLAFSLFLLGCWGTSIAELVLRRRRKARELRRAVAMTGASEANVTAMVNSLGERARCSCPRIAVTPGQVPGAWAYRFGFFRSEHWIEVSEGLVALFQKENDESQLSAILAHEFAHHMRGHCRMDFWLLLWGRITFVGDGFVRAFQDTYGHELAADACAITELGAEPEMLRRALLRAKHMAAALAGIDKATADHIGILPSNGATAELRSKTPRRGISVLRCFADYLRMFARHYTGADRMGYWHPSTQDRLSRLNTLAGRAGNNQRVGS